MPNSFLNARIGGPPATLCLTQYYGTIASVATNPLAGYTQDALPAANQVVGLSPLGATSLTGPQKYEATYNGSFTIQQDVGFSTVAQVGYVMILDRHSLLSNSINNVTSLGTPMGGPLSGTSSNRRRSTRRRHIWISTCRAMQTTVT